MRDVDPQFVIAEIIVLFFGIGLHEYAHCKFADLAGDPTPRYYGRVTLNLTKHFELSGVIFMVITLLTGYGLGWGRPAPMDPRKMRNPRWDWFIAVIAGPLTNVLQAVIYGTVLRILLRSGALDSGSQSTMGFVLLVCILGTLTNLGLALFNMIPFGPLDGKWLLGLLMPEKARYHWFQFNQRVGIFGMFIVIFMLQALHISIMGGPVMYAFRIITGIALPAM